jgi:hypothetical protein
MGEDADAEAIEALILEPEGSLGRGGDDRYSYAGRLLDPACCICHQGISGASRLGIPDPYCRGTRVLNDYSRHIEDRAQRSDNLGRRATPVPGLFAFSE